MALIRPPTKIAATAVAVAMLMTACDLAPDEESSGHGLPEVVEARPEPMAPPPQRTQAQMRQARADAAREANRAAAQTAASPASQNVSVYLRGVESDLIQRGRLRRDRAPDDVRFTASSLARDFLNIALRNEYGSDDTGLSQSGGGGSAPLRRWSEPVQLQLVFGDSIDSAARQRDRASIADFAGRLQRASGHPVSVTGGEGNFVVLVLNEDERRNIGPRLASLMPGIPSRDISALRDLSPRNLCAVFAYSAGAASQYSRAVAVIRDELPHRLRESCIHEELAQGMGLANDSPAARPSIFNDDEEFALLTLHDELLLQILYDTRLRPGMNEAEAAPIVRQIATELVGGET